MAYPDYVPSAEAHEEGELPAPVPGIRYKGRADSRRVYVDDLRGVKGNHTGKPYFSWDRANGHFIPWDVLVEEVGEELLVQFLANNSFEFEPLHLNIDLPEQVEFEVGG